MRTHSIRKSTLAAAVCSVAMWAAPALADAALYVAVPLDGLRNGFAYGLGYDYPNTAQAMDGGKSKCMEQATKHDVDPSLCKLVDVFKRKCAAIAMDPVNRWAGWSIGADKDAASKAAIAACSQNAPACEIADLVCDTK